MISKPFTMFTSLLNLFYPKVCAGCEQLLLSSELVICVVCRHNVPLTNHAEQIENEVYHKFYGRILVETAAAMMYFHKKGVAQKLIHNLKYRNQQYIGQELGRWYAASLENNFKDDIYEIIPVPLHPRKFRERGYNQVTTFAKSLSDGLQIPLNEHLLVRNYYSKTQTKKNLFGRSEIKAQLFEAIFTASDENKHFIIVDDVITTGSTLEACCKAMMKIPGAKISILCIAFSES